MVVSNQTAEVLETWLSLVDALYIFPSNLCFFLFRYFHFRGADNTRKWRIWRSLCKPWILILANLSQLVMFCKHFLFQMVAWLIFIKMPRRCAAGNCSNTCDNGIISLHKWPKDKNIARQWTRAVRTTRDFTPSSSHLLCSAHFEESCFEAQTILSRQLGLNLKPTLLPSAVPTIFLKHRGQKRGSTQTNMTESEITSTSLLTHCDHQPHEKKTRGAFRKREAARVCIYWNNVTAYLLMKFNGKFI